MDLGFVPDLAADVLGTQWREATAQLLVERPNYRVLKLKHDAERVVVKLASEDAPGWVQAETWDRLAPLSTVVRAAGVNTPEIIHIDATLQRCGDGLREPRTSS